MHVMMVIRKMMRSSETMCDCSDPDDPPLQTPSGGKFVRSIVVVYSQWFAQVDRAAYNPRMKRMSIPTGKHCELIRFQICCLDLKSMLGVVLHCTAQTSMHDLDEVVLPGARLSPKMSCMLSLNAQLTATSCARPSLPVLHVFITLSITVPSLRSGLCALCQTEAQGSITHVFLGFVVFAFTVPNAA